MKEICVENANRMREKRKGEKEVVA